MSTRIPYSRQQITEDDVQAVDCALQESLITTGPHVEAFERAFAEKVQARHAVAVSSGTAALHTAMHAIGVGPGDEVIVPVMTFVGTANAVRYVGATPVFVDVNPDTMLIDPACVERAITHRTRAIVAVDYAGQPCNYSGLWALTRSHGLYLVADAAHSLGAFYGDVLVGSLADVTCFSFHPVKHITTGEGGMVTTGNPLFADCARAFRSHGLDGNREMVSEGYNYRITDFQCSLGSSQLARLDEIVEARRGIARAYDKAFAGTAVQPLGLAPRARHSYHLYVVRVPNRDKVMTRMRSKGIGVQVHYRPVHMHQFYQYLMGTGAGLCPVAEQAYEEILSIPVYPGLTLAEQRFVVDELLEAIQ